eukprot:GHVR01165779.1.p1 GENE.GHVR01165779.1~~GHVR01165779.1.p1  ORF type:complete len:366 (+),score=116.38 GHVR01165779.1:94-1191(+)
MVISKGRTLTLKITGSTSSPIVTCIGSGHQSIVERVSLVIYLCNYKIRTAIFETAEFNISNKYYKMLKYDQIKHHYSHDHVNNALEAEMRRRGRQVFWLRNTLVDCGSIEESFESLLRGLKWATFGTIKEQRKDELQDPSHDIMLPYGSTFSMCVKGFDRSFLLYEAFITVSQHGYYIVSGRYVALSDTYSILQLCVRDTNIFKTLASASNISSKERIGKLSSSLQCCKHSHPSFNRLFNIVKDISSGNLIEEWGDVRGEGGYDVSHHGKTKTYTHIHINDLNKHTHTHTHTHTEPSTHTHTHTEREDNSVCVCVCGWVCVYYLTFIPHTLPAAHTHTHTHTDIHESLFFPQRKNNIIYIYMYNS